MSRRLITLAASAAIALGLAVPVLRAEEVAAPEVANSKYQFTGTVNANAVFVRSGPGENYYPTQKLEKGASVTVVGIKFDWLKIVPPEGSFSYVAKVYVEKRGDGSVGRVTKPDLNVRAGSALNAMKTTVQTKLGEGVDVKILGEQEEYFKIAPPEGSFLYVNKQFIDPGQPLVATAIPAKAAEAEAIASDPMKTATPASAQVQVAAASTTQPAGAVAAADLAPSTQPVAQGPTIEQQFDKIEADFLAASGKPIQDQPLGDLKTSYEKILTDNALPVSMRRMGELRLSTIKLRLDAQEQFASAKKAQEIADAKATAQKAEQEELAQRLKANEVTVYAAIGTLRTSSLQQGTGMLYRLTDPGNGRTLVYIRTADPKQLNTYLGQLIGVKGEISQDTVLQAKAIAPSAIEAVEASKVNNGVTAQVLPPSLTLKSQISQAGN